MCVSAFVSVVVCMCARVCVGERASVRYFKYVSDGDGVRGGVHDGKGCMREGMA